MKGNAKTMVLASFVADSLALGAHWIYDVDEIARRFGRVDHLMSPSKDSYHPTKVCGEFTHYGDQALVLLESLAARSGFDLDDFAVKWRGLFNDYSGYFDHATKATLKSLSAGKSPAESGSSSTDLAGASRIAPLAYRYMDDLDGLLSSARSQTAMTHDNPVVIMAAEYFARVVFEILKGGSPVSVMKKVKEKFFQASPIEESISEGIASADKATRSAILKFGQTCGTAGALPSTIHLIARYESSLRDALIENVMAGGDSAARGLLVGMVLGAYLGSEALPADWTSSLKLYRHISDLLEKIDNGR